MLKKATDKLGLQEICMSFSLDWLALEACEGATSQNRADLSILGFDSQIIRRYDKGSIRRATLTWKVGV